MASTYRGIVFQIEQMTVIRRNPATPHRAVHLRAIPQTKPLLLLLWAITATPRGCAKSELGCRRKLLPARSENPCIHFPIAESRRVAVESHSSLLQIWPIRKPSPERGSHLARSFRTR